MAESTVASTGRPLLVCGMHRSGTSYTASLFHAAGVRFAEQLLGPGFGNELGHYEDLGIYQFHRDALQANGLGLEGFVASGTVELSESLEQRGRLLAADRARGGGVWGWKEPRTVLFLDYWDSVLPDAGYVFVFRSPWEVVDSLFRRGDATFADDPVFAAQVWLHYNRTILDFVRGREQRCLLAEVDEVAANPDGLFAAVRSRLGVPLADPPRRFEERLLVRDGDPAHALAIRACLPAAIDVYLQLRERAGAGPPPQPLMAEPDVAALGRHLLAQWRTARQSESRVEELLPPMAGRGAAAQAASGVDPPETPSRTAEALPSGVRTASAMHRIRREARRIVRQAGEWLLRLGGWRGPPVESAESPGGRVAA